MTLTIAAFVLACAASIACLIYRSRVVALRSELLATRIENEERAAQDRMEIDLAKEFDDALDRVSEESRAALEGAIEALQSRHHEVREWTETAPDAILVHRNSAILYANRPAQNLFAASESALYGSDLESWFKNPSKGAECANRSIHHEERLIEQGGSTRTVSVADVPVEFEGTPATLTLLRDLTTQRRIEKRLRLADRMTSLGSLVAGIAHELNNPMSYVLANLEMIGDEIADLPLPPERAKEINEMLAESRDGCMRISTTVGELQRFSRPPPFGNGGSLSQIIGSACAITGSTIRSHAELKVTIDDDAVLAEGADQLTHVLVNLLLNAAESIISQAPNEVSQVVDLRAYRQPAKDGDLIIEVADTGPGISEHIQERIFDPFYTTRLTGKATGLGLPICYSMVAAMGGDLEVQSEEGSGAVMRVRLPSDLGVIANPS